MATAFAVNPVQAAALFEVSLPPLVQELPFQYHFPLNCYSLALLYFLYYYLSFLYFLYFH